MLSLILTALLGVAHAQEACVEPGDALGVTLPFDGRLDSPRATLRWNSGDPPADPQGALDALESAWSAYEAEGFEAPPGSGDHRLLVAALTIPGGGIGGFTDLVPCGDGVVPVLALQTARLDGTGTMRSLVAHELFHAVQAAYVEDFADVSEPWLLEASANYAGWRATGETEEVLDDAEAWASEPWLSWDAGGRSSYGLWVVLGHLGEWGDGWHPALWARVGDSDVPVLDHLAELVPEFESAWTRYLQDAPALRFADLELPRPEDHGGLQADGGLGDAFVLNAAGNGLAIARVDLAGAEAVVVDGEGPLFLAAARDGRIEARSVSPDLGLDVGDFDTLYVTAQGARSVEVTVRSAEPRGRTWWSPEADCGCATGGPGGTSWLLFGVWGATRRRSRPAA